MGFSSFQNISGSEIQGLLEISKGYAQSYPQLVDIEVCLDSCLYLSYNFTDYLVDYIFLTIVGYDTGGGCFETDIPA